MWRVAARRFLAYAAGMGLLGSVQWMVFRDHLPLGAALFGLTICLIGLVVWNETYGTPLYDEVG